MDWIKSNSIVLVIFIFILAHWYGSLFFQTFFLHRYSAHKMFEMSRGWEKAFFVLSWLAQGSSYLSPYGYGVMHRMHHAFADTELDPHSPKYDKTALSMMLRSAKEFNDILLERKKIDPVYTHEVPKWKSFDLFANKKWVRISWGLSYIAFYIAFATDWWMFLFLPLHFVMGPFHGVIVNWCAHKYGYTNFKTNNTSKNFLPFDFLMMGESYHNNHHANSSNPNFGHRWFELDLTYPLVRVLDWMKIIRLKKSA